MTDPTLTPAQVLERHHRAYNNLGEAMDAREWPADSAQPIMTDWQRARQAEYISAKQDIVDRVGEIAVFAYRAATELARLQAENAALEARAEAMAAEGVWVIIAEPTDPYEHDSLMDGAWRTEAEARREADRLQAEEAQRCEGWPVERLNSYVPTFQPFMPAASAGGTHEQ